MKMAANEYSQNYFPNLADDTLRYMQRLHSHIGIVAPFLFFAALLLLFSLERLVIRLVLPEFFADSSTIQTFTAMLIGLRFDIVIAATLACPLIVLVIAGPLFEKPRFQKFISAQIAVTLGLVVFACIADFYFFRQFGERLNHKALVYLESDYLYKIIWNDYPILTLAFVFCLVTLFLYKAITRLIASQMQRAAIPALSIAEVILIPVLMVAVAALSIRGSLGPKAINTSPAYFCSSAPVAQLTLNGLFTLREAAISLTCRHEKISKYYKLVPPKQAAKNVVDLISRPGDRFCQSPSNPLHRITDTGQPRQDYNVVLVVLESLSWHYIGAMGGAPSYTPNLDKLIPQGLFMDECFAVGNRTTRGFSAIVSGYPDLPGKSVSTRPQTEGRFLTLASVLKSRGYETMFIYGGQPSYDHRQAFLGSNGYTTLIFKDDFAARTFKAELGYCDEDLFNQSLLEFQKRQDKPFFATLLTLSFHRSWKIPSGKITPEPTNRRHREEINAIRYTDWAIGRFIEQASALPCFKNTLFVFIADHMGGFKENPTTAASYRIPFLIYAPNIVSPARLSGICSQVDVAPTIMHLLGGSYEHCFFGASVIDRDPGEGYAWLLNGQQLIFINGLRQGIILSPNNQREFFVFTTPNILDPLSPEIPSPQLSQMPVSILQVATDLYQNAAYNLPEPSPQTMSRISPVARGRQPRNGSAISY